MKGKAVGFFLGLWCAGAGSAFSQSAPSVVLSEEAKQNIKLELAAAGKRDIHEILSISGMMREQSGRVVWAAATVKGQIAKVFIKNADKVGKGQVLFTLFAPELERLRTELVQGMEKLKLRNVELERARSLYERGILAERDLVRAETELALTRSQVEAARRGIYLLGMTEAELSALLVQPDKPAFLPVHSPIDGHVTFMEAYQGDTVDPARRIVRIMDTSVLWAEGDVFERDVPKLRTGQEVSLVLRPFKQWRFTGTIKSISADLSKTKRTAHLWIEVPNPKGALKPQMAVDIAILLSKKTEALAVPKEAVLEEQGESFVFVENGDAFLRQPVVTGSTDHLYCEILKGLYEGDKVVTRGNHELRLAVSSQGPQAGSDGHLHSH